MILEADVAFVIRAAEIVQQFECEGPFLLGELAGLEKLGPLGSPEMIFNDILAILAMDHGALVNHDASAVPLTERLLVLGNCRDQE